MDNLKIEIATERNENTYFARIDPKAEEKFLNTLRQRDRHTDFVPVSTPSDLMMDRNACVHRSLKYTASALAAVCDKLLPGLFSSVSYLSGLKSDPDSYDPQRDQTLSLAIKLFNEVARARFHRLQGYRLVVDRYDHIVDGIVSSQYAFINNLEVYEQLKPLIPEWQFNEAVLVGRTMRVLLELDNPADIAPQLQDRCRPGVCLMNSEAMNSALSIAQAIIYKPEDAKFVKPVAYSNRIIHKGNSVGQRVHNAIKRVVANPYVITEATALLSDFPQITAELGLSERSRKQMITDLIQLFYRHGIRKSLVKTALAKLTFPSNAVVSVRSLNALDLLSKLAVEARSLRLVKRHQMEQILYKMITDTVVSNLKNIMRV